MTEGNPAPPPLDTDPDRPLDWTPDWHRDVTLWPWGAEDPGGYHRAAGIFAQDGRHIADSHCWRYAEAPCTVPPVPDGRAVAERLAGRWLFGGIFYAHFGHFLVETTARLWAVEAAGGAAGGAAGAEGGDLAGIVFYPKQRLVHEFRPLKPLVPFFRKLGLGHLKLRMPQDPVTIEAIALPPPAIGIGAMIAGRPEYRRFMRTRLCDGVAPDGASDIYISRSGLTSRRGRVVLERALEARMAAEGYLIFHPQEHDIAAQVAQYRAARRIVALDGSALHLAAMVAEPQTRVAILNRGPSRNIEDYLLQFRAFAGIEATRIDAVTGFWAPGDSRLVRREVQARLDFRAAGSALAEAGFIRRSSIWSDPPETEIAASLAELSRSYGAALEYRDIA